MSTADQIVLWFSGFFVGTGVAAMTAALVVRDAVRRG